MMPAAGSGQRMGAGFNKLFLKLGDKPILVHTLDVFEQDPSCVEVILAVKLSEREEIQSFLDEFNIKKVTKMVEGGAERQHSVSACLEAHKGGGIVLVHDAARPFILHSTIQKLVQAATEYGSAIAGVKAKDTMKFAENNIVERTVNRDNLWVVQTPQVFTYDVLKKATYEAEQVGFLGTDESMLVERLGHPVRMIESTYDNVKMTTQDDLVFGEILLKRRKQEEDV